MTLMLKTNRLMMMHLEEFIVRQADEPPLQKKSKIVKPPHKKLEKVKSTTHGLSAIARGINSSITAQEI